MTVDEQFQAIKRGTLEIVPEEGLKDKLKKSQATGKPLKIKLGIDPTAPDIHIGFAVVLRKMRQFQDLGHEVILIVGDFTASIGDPSGKSETRPVLSAQQIRENAESFTSQFWFILDRAKTKLVFNGDWLGKMTFSDVIKETSRITVARILERDDFEKRLAEGRPISMHELLYPICQAYDSVVLESDVEVGGSDQKFNILMGRDLQTQHGQQEQIGLFMPILPGLDGVQKMSKSLGNYVGIAEPPNQMFGKLMSIPDEIMPAYFELCTDVSLEEIAEMKSGVQSGKLHPMDVKKRLGREIVTIYHSSQAADEAQAEFERVFSRHDTPTDMPELVVEPGDVADGAVWIAKLLVKAGMAPSNSEARRLVQQGAVTIDGKKVADPSANITPKDGQIIKAGKLKFARIRLG